jgi:undecaprenyl-diphosphatase
MTEYIFYTAYGLIQGITEFIPISSSGHLNIIEILFTKTDSRNLLYETTGHFASLLALLIYLFKNGHFIVSNFQSNFIAICIATMPAFVIGLVFVLFRIDFVSLQLIGVTSILGAILLYISDAKIFRKIKISNNRLKFFIAGLFQCLAFLPGFSRSGSCIIAFQILGEDKKSSSVKSLYLGIPIILISFMANILKLNEITVDLNLIIIFIVTFISAYLTLIFFIKFISKIGFTPFVVYRIILGVIILSLF